EVREPPGCLKQFAVRLEPDVVQLRAADGRLDDPVLRGQTADGAAREVCVSAGARLRGNLTGENGGELRVQGRHPRANVARRISRQVQRTGATARRRAKASAGLGECVVARSLFFLACANPMRFQSSVGRAGDSGGGSKSSHALRNAAT